MDEILKAIDEALERTGMSDAAASRLAVNHPSLIKNLRNSPPDRQRGHPIENLKKLAEVLGLVFYFGPPEAFIEPYMGRDVEQDFVPVSRYDVALSAGAGAAAEAVDQGGPVAFRARWLMDRGLRADRCCVVSIRGDSMTPALHDGDIVLIDTRATDIRDSQVYAFVDTSGDLRVKRLQRGDGMLILRSDNTAHPAEIRTPADTAQMKILGAVRWSGHTW